MITPLGIPSIVTSNPWEQFADVALTYLTSAIGTAEQIIPVASVSGFPATGNFRLAVGNEIMLATGVSGNAFIVMRGAETMSFPAPSGTQVGLILSSGSFNALTTQHVLSGPVSGCPVPITLDLAYQPAQDPNFNGSLLYFSTDSPLAPYYSQSIYTGLYLYYPNPYLSPGTADTLMVEGYGFGQLFCGLYPAPQLVTPPSFTWVNAGSATTGAIGNSVQLTVPPTATESMRALTVTPPPAPYTVTACVKATSLAPSGSYGICVGGSVIRCLSLTGRNAWVRTLTSATAFASGSTPISFGSWTPTWFRISDDGLNTYYYVSSNSRYWNLIYSNPSMAATYAGWFADSLNANFSLMATLVSWQVTQP